MARHFGGDRHRLRVTLQHCGFGTDGSVVQAVRLVRSSHAWPLNFSSDHPAADRARTMLRDWGVGVAAVLIAPRGKGAAMSDRILITGASSGLGLLTARELAGQGRDLVLGCQDRGRAEQAAESIRATHSDVRSISR